MLKRLTFTALLFSFSVFLSSCFATRGELERERMIRENLAHQFYSYKRKTDLRLSEIDRKLSDIERKFALFYQKTVRELRRFNKTLSSLKDKLKQGEGGIIEMFTTLQKLQVRFQESLGKIEILQNQIRELLQKLPEHEKLFEEIRSKYEELLKNQKLLSEQVIPAKLFARARDSYKQGKLNEAKKYFSEFLVRFPGHPLADNALLYLGDIARKQKNFSEAILKYSEIVKKYPSGSEAPQALFRLGIIHYKLGLCREGRTFLKRIRLYRGRASKLAKRAETLYKSWRSYCKRRRSRGRSRKRRR